MPIYVGLLQECDAEDYGPGRVLRVDIYETLEEAVIFKRKFNREYLEKHNAINDSSELVQNFKNKITPGYKNNVWDLWGGTGYTILKGN